MEKYDKGKRRETTAPEPPTNPNDYPRGIRLNKEYQVLGEGEKFIIVYNDDGIPTLIPLEI